MNYRTIYKHLVSVFASMVIVGVVNAGSISYSDNQFVANEPLTADSLNFPANEVKTAVNDNDSKLTILTNSINSCVAGNYMTGVDATGKPSCAPATSSPGANSVGASQIQTNAVTNSKILNAAVTGLKIATDAINTTHISAGAVTTNEIGTGAVTTNEIKDGSITRSKIATGAIMQPIAMGVVRNNTFATKTLNLASISWDAALNRYEITITGENYFINNYVTVVTPIGSGNYASSGSVGGKLLVKIE
ncbi:MAG: hypothetical protein ACC707_02090, partial [Thiohalomonadales bacterium]